MVYRLFLSHSSPSEPARQRLASLATAIESAPQLTGRIKVLYDREQIIAGDDWRDRIAFMLHVCHGAAVLLDDAALSSKWVLAEATVASLRHSYDEDFLCIPVSFLDQDDLAERLRGARQTAQLVETDWSVVSLRDIQFVQEYSVDEIAGKIVEALQARNLVETDSPVDRLASQLMLALADVSMQQLQLLAEAVQDVPYLRVGDSHRAAVALVRKMLRSNKLVSVRDVLDDLGPAYPDQQLLTILDALWPLTLAAEAAERLRRRRPGGPGYAHSSICCEHAAHVVPLYVKRAYLARRPPTHYAIDNIHGTFEELSAGVRDGWRRKNARVRELTDDQIDDRLASSDRDVYVWVPGPLDSEILEKLDAAYPRVAFIVHHGHDSGITMLPPNIQSISPALTKSEEAAIFDDYEDATASLMEGDNEL